MKFINQLRARFGTTKLIIVALFIGAVVYYLFFTNSAQTNDVAIVAIPQVTTASVGALADGSAFTAVGTVEAVSEAELQVEAGGRVIAVYPALGSTVAAGTIIARLEGAMQSAAMLQAQGAYEAALAGAAQGDIGKIEASNSLTAAQNTAITTYKNAYTTVSGTVFSSLDQFYANPNSQIPGVRIGTADVKFQNTERVKLQSSLPAWQKNTLTLTTSGDITKSLTDAEMTTKQVLAMIDDFIKAFNKAEVNSQYTEADYRDLVVAFSGVRSQLTAVLSSIDSARSNLASAQENVNRAQISGTGSTVSSADAQVKIALGSLRAAQAAYEKTLVRTPITGVVNALYLKTGEYATPGARAALIANNNGLEIKTSISQDDALQLQIGDTVTIDNTATGTISQIAGAIDPSTGKVAIKISISENGSLQNGSTVSIAFSTSKKTAAKEISVPLAAVKMTGSGPVVFSVDSSDTLVATPITLGAISGESVVVTSGITTDSVIVTDGRGLKAGEKVNVTKK